MPKNVSDAMQNFTGDHVKILSDVCNNDFENVSQFYKCIDSVNFKGDSVIKGNIEIMRHNL